jgi:hypothetical protein
MYHLPKFAFVHPGLDNVPNLSQIVCSHCTYQTSAETKIKNGRDGDFTRTALLEPRIKLGTENWELKIKFILPPS